MFSNRIIIIAVTGRSGSGKTTVADNLVKHFGEKNAIVLSTDRYYRGRNPDQTREEFNKNTNFDEPGALKLNELATHIRQLRSGNNVYVPTYDMTTSLSEDNAELITARSVIIIEGIFALHDPAVRELIDISVFVNAPSDIALARRASRDKQHRNYSYEHTINLVSQVLRPCYDEYLKPWKNKTHIRLENSRDISDTTRVCIDPIIALAERKLKAGVLIMLMGPSGVGKSTIIKKLIEESGDSITKVINYTTRAKRDGENEGVDYHFISLADYKKKLAENFFIATMEYDGNYYAAEDFTPSLLQGKNWIMDCLPVIERQIRAKVADYCKTIAINASLDELRKRLENRNEKPTDIARRMEHAPAQIEACKYADIALANKDLNETVAAVKTYIPRRHTTLLAHNEAATLRAQPTLNSGISLTNS